MTATLASYVLINRSFVFFQNLNLILEHTGYLWFVKKLKKCCFLFQAYKVKKIKELFFMGLTKII